MNKEIISLISRRRRQMMVHSQIYYELNDNLIDDNTWAEWAMELVKLQKDFPLESSEADLYDEFKDFDASTGQNLDYRQGWVSSVVNHLFIKCGKKKPYKWSDKK